MVMMNESNGGSKFPKETVGMTIVEVLERIERINRDDVASCAEFGPLETGPRGETVSRLICVDGKTSIAASPQIRTFYGYALWWKLCSVELEWCNPLDIATIMAGPPVSDMIRGDLFEAESLVEGMTASNSVLFSLDNHASPYDRAYFVFGDATEPRVVYAGAEVSEFESLQTYLVSWLRTLS